ncbi:MAG: arginine--tRNA ligase [Vicingaceae bacterium]
MFAEIEHTISEAINKLYNQRVENSNIQLQKTKPEFSGDITLVVFPLVKILKENPQTLAENIGEYLKQKLSYINDFNVIKGFLNIELKNSFWINQFEKILENETFGYKKPQSSGKCFMVEYSSPNTNKPLHLGHLRNNFLGYSVAEILKANGHKIYKTQIINDRGIHICKSMVAWLKYGNNETPESSGMKGDKLVGKYYVEFDKAYKQQINELINQGYTKEAAEKNAPILIEAQNMLKKWEEGDEGGVNLWKTMNAWVYDGFEETYKTMGVDFDKLYYESDTYLLGKNIVEEGLKKGVFYKKEDGSVWADLKAYNLDDKLLLRADGTSVYMTQDIGTAVERFKDFPELDGLIYTVGNEQNHHFKVLFILLKILGYDWADNCYHLSYGMVDLPSGKMKSREGTVVDADDLMESVIDDARKMTEERGHIEQLSEMERKDLYKTIGLGGLKYFLLKVDPKKRMLFNPQESIDLNGNTGPFIQYAYARIQSLLDKNDDKIENTGFVTEDLELVEKELFKKMLDFESVVEEAGKQYNPSIIANYTYDLVKTFNNFYQNIPILKEEDEHKKVLRLLIAKKTGEIIKNSMALLGINVPNKM